MAHSIGPHLECAIQAEMVVELGLALIERKSNLVDFGTNPSYARKLRKGFESVPMSKVV